MEETRISECTNIPRSFARNIRVIYTSSRQLTSTLKNGGPRNWP